LAQIVIALIVALAAANPESRKRSSTIAGMTYLLS